MNKAQLKAQELVNNYLRLEEDKTIIEKLTKELNEK